jgi:putative ABC transport system substrate-binding protein
MRRREFNVILGAALATLPTSVVAWAQRGARTHILGVLVQAPRNAAHWNAFFDELRKEGFAEGGNLSVVHAFDTTVESADSTAVRVVNAQPDVIVTAGAFTRILQRATQSIPIVTVSDDLLAEQVVASLSRPGGNVTGISILGTELDGKRLEILMETVPAARRIGILADQTVTTSQQLKNLESAASARDVTVSTQIASRGEDVMPAIDRALSAGAQALNVLASSLFNAHRKQIITRMISARLPAIFQWPEMSEEGGLIAYGPRFVSLYRLQAQQAAKVLNGTKPADIPIEQPTKFELVVNLKTAKSIGLLIPHSLLLRADEVIE